MPALLTGAAAAAARAWLSCSAIHGRAGGEWPRCTCPAGSGIQGDADAAWWLWICLRRWTHHKLSPAARDASAALLLAVSRAAVSHLVAATPARPASMGNNSKLEEAREPQSGWPEASWQAEAEGVAAGGSPAAGPGGGGSVVSRRSGRRTRSNLPGSSDELESAPSTSSTVRSSRAADSLPLAASCSPRRGICGNMQCH